MGKSKPAGWCVRFVFLDTEKNRIYRRGKLLWGWIAERKDEADYLIHAYKDRDGEVEHIVTTPCLTSSVLYDSRNKAKQAFIDFVKHKKIDNNDFRKNNGFLDCEYKFYGKSNDEEVF